MEPDDDGRGRKQAAIRTPPREGPVGRAPSRWPS